MRTRALGLVMLLGVAAAVFAAGSHLGTWKLNEAKSQLAPGATKNHTVIYVAAGDSVKITVDGIDKDGKAIHNEWTGKFDGKDYPVTGDSAADARAYTKVDDTTLTFANKKAGKTIMTGRIVLSADGKTRTVTVTSTDAQGKEVTGTSVFDKQ